MDELWIGLDAGTTAIKAAAYRADGTCVAKAERAAEVLRPADGHAEQDMDAVWRGARDCLGALMAQCAGHPVRAIGLCAQGDGLWPVDARGEAVRPAILWSDTRKAAVADLNALAASGGTAAVGRGCHTALWPGTAALAWRWLRREEPGNAARVARLLTCGDWVGLKLTGVAATDFSNASIPFLDFGSRAYGGAVGALGCEDALPLLSAPRPARSVLGTVLPGVAGGIGLPAGVPVTVATLDLAATVVGLGMARPGETMMIMGTTAVVTILTDTPAPREEPVAASVLHPTSDTVIRVLAPATGAAAFDWFASLHPLSLGGDGPDAVATRLNALVERVPAGANGVTFLPYLNGERAPFVAPDLRASFHGLSARTTKGELGRAVMEGTALSLRHCFECETGLPARPVHLTGGGARNPVWCAIIADVVGQDVLVNPAADLGLWGAACIGAGATGLGDPVALAARDGPVTRYAPDPARHAAYGAVHARYVLLSEAQRALQPRLESLGDPAP